MSTTQITAAGKVLKVLSTFDRERPSQTLSEIAQRTGLALSTTHRVVTELAGWGALEREEDGSWHVGLRLWEIASGCPRTQILRDVALPFMQDLYEATHENIQLAVREGTELVFVERIAGHRSVELVTMVGARFPIGSTGMGRVLLAHAPRDIQEEVLEAPLRAWTPHTVTNPKTLRAQLDRIRREQVFVSDRQLSESTVAVAAPVRIGRTGPVSAALGIVIAAHGAARAQGLREPLLRAAYEVSDELGRRAHRTD
ncbi:IclR family transcriptional regulator [Streptomyces sp. ISL-94]|uniref:IclR family transcriptional regulator n=1 Tax=Streptomyces sp. ISL-94 TaxID=2819190 RepID=UPI001BEADD8D|nr:IclR family transcriptional regulator [Streptomyces sp. ISL-94]MBT2479757.1 IclR family transcriptional regulator [Streptomyces sp. ISL-94]